MDSNVRATFELPNENADCDESFLEEFGTTEDVSSSSRRSSISKGRRESDNTLPSILKNDGTSSSHRRRSVKFGESVKSIILDSKLIELTMKSWNSSRDVIYEKSEIQRNRSILKKANVWTTKQFIGYWLWTFFAILIQNIVGGTFFGNWAFPDGSKPVCSSSGKGDVIIGTQNRNICGFFHTLDAGSSRFILLAAFIIGGFVISSVQLWLIRRGAYTALCGATRNLLLQICSIVDKDHPHEKELLSRWAVLGFELSILKGRQLIDTDEAKEYLINLNLIKSNEWDEMIDGDRHTSVWFWIQVKAKQLEEMEVINDTGFAIFNKSVTISRDAANDLMSCINRDQPPPYVFVCASLINIHLLLHSVMTGLKWAIWMYDSNENTGLSVWTEPRMYLDVFVLFFYTCIYAMLFDLCALLYNPFGPRMIDIHHYECGKQIRRFAKDLCRKPLPGTMRSNDTGRKGVGFLQDNTEEEKLKKEDFALSLMVRRPKSFEKTTVLTIGT
jgi:hypothetical protein